MVVGKDTQFCGNKIWNGKKPQKVDGSKRGGGGTLQALFPPDHYIIINVLSFIHNIMFYV